MHAHFAANAMKTLVGAAAYEISALDSASPESESESESRGTNTYGRLHVPMQGLTTDPQVAGYMFNNEVCVHKMILYV